MDIKAIIAEELQALNEGLSDIIYHFTHVGNLQNILATNKLNTSSNLGTTADAQKDRGRTFYFSTQRSKGKSGYGRGITAVLVLDGRALMTKYKGFPTDYWNWSMSRKDYDDQQGYMQALQSKEMEDRIVTHEPHIEPASKYILEIHIDLSRPWYIKKSEAQALQVGAQQLGIPIYFYDDKNHYELQNKNKAKSLDDIHTEFMDEDQERYNSGNRHFYYRFKELAPYIFFDTRYESEFWQLFTKFLQSENKVEHFNDYKQEIDKRVKEVHDFYSQDRYKDWYHIDSKYISLMSDFHNAKSSTDPYYREFLKLLVKDMRDFNASDLKQYFSNKLGLRSQDYWNNRNS